MMISSCNLFITMWKKTPRLGMNMNVRMSNGVLWVAVLACWNLLAEVSSSPWSSWWSYNGHAGPLRWGYLNPDWLLCRSGRFQSPIDIEPRLLLFDPRLRRLRSNVSAKVDGLFRNTGNDLTFDIDDVNTQGANFSGGPLLYGYKAFQIKIHFGKFNTDGSEHKIDGRGFAAEVQILCYNTNLFKSYDEAWKKPYGVAVLSVLAEIGQDRNVEINEPFNHLVTMASKIPWQDQTFRVENLDLKGLLPATKFYITYEGSLTQPGCYETVTWVVFNKPIFIEASQLDTLRDLQKGQSDNRMTMTEGNIRPIQAINNRVLRTNINYPSSNGGLCDMKKVTFYEANESIRRNQKPSKKRKS